MQILKKIIQNKKKSLLTLAAFLFALITIHFEFSKNLFKTQTTRVADQNTKVIEGYNEGQKIGKIPNNIPMLQEYDNEKKSINQHEEGKVEEAHDANKIAILVEERKIEEVSEEAQDTSDENKSLALHGFVGCRFGSMPVASPFTTEGQVLEVVISNDEILDFQEGEDLASISQLKDLVQPAKLSDNEVAERNISRTKASSAYLNQISNISNLIVKFLQKSDFRAELNKIDKTKLPSEIQSILSDMESFAKNYIEIPYANKLIFPKKGILDKVIGHFVQVEKASCSYKAMNEKYEQIRKKLYVIEGYFYSEKFLSEMMDHD